MSTRRHSALGSVWLFMSLSCAAALPSKPAGSEGGAQQAGPRSRLELREPKWLPSEAREMLTQRMRRHGQDMMFLSASVVLLNHDVTLELSERIAAEPWLGRPAPAEQGTLNALLPARFFDLEDELRERARGVGAAASAKDDARLAKAYGQLVESCVSCHSVYLEDDFAAAERE